MTGCTKGFLIILLLWGSVGLAQTERGKIVFEVWDQVSGDTLDGLYNDLRWPDYPTRLVSELNLSPPSRGDSYAQRAQGYLYPPQNGQYTFYIASDNDSELWLSTDENPANARRVAWVYGTTSTGQYYKYPSQQSEPVSLAANRPYYIDVRHKEGTGGDLVNVAWIGPGVDMGTVPVVIGGMYLGTYIRPASMKATNPTPANGFVGQSQALLKWVPSPNAASQKVYLGTTPNLGPAQIAATKGAKDNSHLAASALVPGQVYFWRIDTLDSVGVAYTGDVWRFTARPFTACNPSPANGAQWVSPSSAVLTWLKGQTAAKHELFLGENPAALVLLGTLTAEIYAPNILKPGAVYYWRVDEIDSAGARFIGDLWQFTTFAPAGLRGEYYPNMDLSGSPSLIRQDPTVSFKWGQGSPAGLPVDGFSVRWSGELQVPKTGAYVLSIAANDGARLILDGQVLVNRWGAGSGVDRRRLDLAAGRAYGLVVEYFESDLPGSAEVELTWEYWDKVGETLKKEVIPEGPLSPLTRALVVKPVNQGVGVTKTTQLQWKAVPNATGHDVYLSQDPMAVDQAGPGSAGVYLGRPTVTSIQPAGLQPGKTYYWRIDEVTPATAMNPRKGVVWSFTTSVVEVVDDFEAYGWTETDNPVWNQWFDGFASHTSGSIAGYDLPPFVELVTVQGGRQSMPLRYDNTGTASYAPGSNYSEVTRTFTPLQDWTKAKKLELYFYGLSGNTIEVSDRLYVTLEDGSGRRVSVTYSGPSTDYQDRSWRAWQIDLTQFVGSNLASVKGLTLGVGDRAAPKPGLTGTLLIDSIGLLP